MSSTNTHATPFERTPNIAANLVVVLRALGGGFGLDNFGSFGEIGGLF